MRKIQKFFNPFTISRMCYLSTGNTQKSITSFQISLICYIERSFSVLIIIQHHQHGSIMAWSWLMPNDGDLRRGRIGAIFKGTGKNTVREILGYEWIVIIVKAICYLKAANCGIEENMIKIFSLCLYFRRAY